MRPVLKCITVVVVLASVGFVCAQGTPEKGIVKDNSGLHTEISTDSEKDKDRTQNVTVVVNPEHPQNLKSNAKETDEDIDTQRNLVRFTKLLVVVGVIQSVILAITGLILGLQIFAMISSERAWLSVKRVGNPPEDWLNRVKSSYVVGVILEFSVFGKTPARITEARFALRLIPTKNNSRRREPDLPENPNYAGITGLEITGKNTIVIAPGGDFRIQEFLSPPPKPEDLEETRDGKKVLCVYGFIKYKDAFGRGRETRACFVYDFSFGGILRSPDGIVLNPAGFRPGGSAAYNQAT